MLLYSEATKACGLSSSVTCLFVVLFPFEFILQLFINLHCDICHGNCKTIDLS